MGKILITTRFIPHQPTTDTGSQLARGFSELGHDVVLFGNFYGQPQRFNGLDRIGEKFDLFIAMECNDGQGDYSYLLHRSNLKNVKRLYYDFDASYGWDSAYVRAAAYQPHMLLVANKNYLDMFYQAFKKPVKHLPYACSPHFHRRLDVPKEYLLGFVGSITPERKKLLDQFPNEIFVTEGVYGEDYIKALNKCCVVFHKNQDSCRGLIPGRPFEATGCGSSLLMDKVAYEDFVEILPVELHNHIFKYEDEKDIAGWIDYWKDRKTDLIILGEELQEYMYQNHTYKNRAEQIINEIQS